jgi:hypothetical protein
MTRLCKTAWCSTRRSSTRRWSFECVTGTTRLTYRFVTPYQSLLHGMMGLGVLSLASKLHKWSDLAMYFDGTSLGILPVYLCLPNLTRVRARRAVRLRHRHLPILDHPLDNDGRAARSRRGQSLRPSPGPPAYLCRQHHQPRYLRVHPDPPGPCGSSQPQICALTSFRLARSTRTAWTSRRVRHSPQSSRGRPPPRPSRRRRKRSDRPLPSVYCPA